MNITVLLAIAMLLFVSICDASADLTKKDVKRIVKRTIESSLVVGPTGAQGIPGVQGAPGLQGPAGPATAAGFIYALITPDAGVVEERSSGIFPGNVRLIGPPVFGPFDDRFQTRILPFSIENGYCFILPGARGGQVTINSADSGAGLSAEINFESGGPEVSDCTFFVTIKAPGVDRLQKAGFYILVY